LVSEVGADRTSVRLSPNGNSQGVDDSNPEALFTAAAKALAAHKIAFLELREPPVDGTFGATDVPRQSPAIRKVFPGPLVLNSDYDAASGQAALDSGVADAISFGRPFLANPDLPERLRIGATLNEGAIATWYSQGDEGYIDYPALDPVAA
jgi:N-ethylmaleimide reductase